MYSKVHFYLFCLYMRRSFSSHICAYSSTYDNMHDDGNYEHFHTQTARLPAKYMYIKLFSS